MLTKNAKDRDEPPRTGAGYLQSPGQSWRDVPDIHNQVGNTICVNKEMHSADPHAKMPRTDAPAGFWSDSDTDEIKAVTREEG